MISPPGVQGFHPPFVIFPLHHPKTHHNWCKHAFCFSFHIIMMIMMFLPLHQIRWLFCGLFGEGDREGDCDPVSRTPCSATVDTEFPCRTDTVPLGSRSGNPDSQACVWPSIHRSSSSDVSTNIRGRGTNPPCCWGAWIPGWAFLSPSLPPHPHPADRWVKQRGPGVMW